ncbi:MAG TPA: hypothetical protein PK597_01655 [Oscillospiraceae bacterium]|nr:hypothetical protein [Oscillospiraceae bacterium]
MLWYEWALLVLVGALLAAVRFWWVPRFVKWLQDHDAGEKKQGKDGDK